MGLLSALRAQWRSDDERRAADAALLIPDLEPIIEAERRRGNQPIDHWHKVWTGPSPDVFGYERRLRFPLDEEAIRAEFDVDPNHIVLGDNRVGLWDRTALLRGGSRPSGAERAAQWDQARERWWAEWREGPQRPRSLRIPVADRFRLIAALEPVLAAERSRGNQPVDEWHRGDDGWYERRLQFPLDLDALRAEFVFDDEVWLHDNRVGSARDEAVLHGGTRPLSKHERAARQLWWQRWRSAPRSRRTLSECAS